MITPFGGRVITYEYPFNERIRTLLRLEDLFDKATYFLNQQSSRDHHVALLTLFEILDVAGRSDVKMDMIQELERQRHALLSFRNNPQISEEALSGVLYDIESSSAALISMSGKIGQYLRQNEWLMGIKNRAFIPGGVCEFDLPSYHYWQHQDSDARRQELEEWQRPFLPLREGIFIVLRLLRSGGKAETQMAKDGAFQLMLGGTVSQMVVIDVAKDQPFVPEISANKYALNIRFSHPPNGQRSRHVDAGTDVPFQMTFCNL